MKFNVQQMWIGFAIFGSILSLTLYFMVNSGGSSSSYGSYTSPGIAPESSRSNACIKMLKSLQDGEKAYASRSNANSDAANGLRDSMRNLRSTYMDICS